MSELLGPLEGQNIPHFAEDIASFLVTHAKKFEEDRPEDENDLAEHMIRVAKLSDPKEKEWLETLISDDSREDELSTYAKTVAKLKEKYYPPASKPVQFTEMDDSSKLDFLITRARRDEFAQFLTYPYALQSKLEMKKAEDPNYVLPNMDVARYGFNDINSFYKFFSIEGQYQTLLEEIKEGITHSETDESSEDTLAKEYDPDHVLEERKLKEVNDLATKGFLGFAYFNYVFPYQSGNETLNRQRAIALHRLGYPEDLPYFDKLNEEPANIIDFQKIRDAFINEQINLRKAA